MSDLTTQLCLDELGAMMIEIAGEETKNHQLVDGVILRSYKGV